MRPSRCFLEAGRERRTSIEWSRSGETGRDLGRSVVILRKPVPGLSDRALARFVARAARRVGLRGVVNVLVTGNRELQTLNRRFRAKDSATDVLSFAPMPGLAEGLAGDIAVSAEIAARNARSLGHPPAKEIKILVLHGVLHLAGYDHETDQGEMARKEAKLRRSLRLPVGLVERSGHLGLNQVSNKRSRKKAKGADKSARPTRPPR
jgi:probable rRNA maturation factor